MHTHFIEPVRQVLTLAREMFAVGWTNEGYARTWDGRSCCWSSEYAAAVCLTGGMMRACAHLRFTEFVHDAALGLLESVCPPMVVEDTRFAWMGEPILETFNDRYARDARDVIDLIDRALAKLPPEEVVDTGQLELLSGPPQQLLPGLR